MRFLYFKTLFSLILMAAAVWLAMAFLLPLFFPFLLGAILALASEPGVAFLGKKTRLPRGLCAGIGVSLTFAGIAVLALFLGAFLLRELGALSGVLNLFADWGGNILTINQGIPIQNVAIATIAFETAHMEQDLETVIEIMEELSGVLHVEIVGQG